MNDFVQIRSPSVITSRTAFSCTVFVVVVNSFLNPAEDPNYRISGKHSHLSAFETCLCTKNPLSLTFDRSRFAISIMSTNTQQ